MNFPKLEILKKPVRRFLNAFIKARTVHEFTGLPSLADDTGLEVDSLGGAQVFTLLDMRVITQPIKKTVLNCS